MEPELTPTTALLATLRAIAGRGYFVEAMQPKPYLAQIGMLVPLGMTLEQQPDGAIRVAFGEIIEDRASDPFFGVGIQEWLEVIVRHPQGVMSEGGAFRRKNSDA